MKFSTKFVAATQEYSTFEKPIPAPIFRREFELGKINSAEITLCGLGIYDLFVNGQKITRGLLSPYLYNPDDILYYDNYDLTPYLCEGKNVIGIWLGNGMLDSFGGQVWEFEKARFRSAPKVAFTFEAELENGEKIEFDSTNNLKCTESPIYCDDIRIGEFYDATKELGDWTNTDYDDSSWRNTVSAETPRGECRLCDVDPILPTKEISPLSIKYGKISLDFGGIHPLMKNLPDEINNGFPEGEENNGGYIYDFGVNAAGLCRLHIKNAKPGQKIVLQFAEKLAQDGGLDLRGMSFLPHRYNHRDIYICKGGDETYMPRFTYHGFRYCLVMGITEEQAIPELLTYVVMNTYLADRSHFECSDETANKLWDAAIVSDLANFYHFPTDCPHREKNGWTGDAALSAEQMVMALSPERNWREWMHNIGKSMNDAGAIPGIIPTAGWGFAWGNGPAWDIVLVNLPYYTWLYRGDLTIAKENATSILRYINYITTRVDDKGLIHIGLGDWCPTARGGNVPAPLEFTDTVTCIDFCTKAAKLFSALEMKHQQTFAEGVKNDLLCAARKYLIDINTMSALGRCQTTQAMAIYYDIFTEAEKPFAFARLVELIDKNNGSFDCGILGLRVIFHVLSKFGRTDLAYRMITKPDFPSYGYQIACGSTSIWEDFRLDSERPNSRNHHFFCDYISWFMKNLVGINVNPYENNAAEIRLAPRFIDALDSASGDYDSIGGKVSAKWVREGEDILYTFDIPAGVKAEIVLEPGKKFEDGHTYKHISGNQTLRIIDDSKYDNKTTH